MSSNLDLLKKIARGILPWFAFSMLMRYTPLHYLVLVWLLLIATQVVLGWRALKDGNPVAIVALVLFVALFANGYTNTLPWANVYAATLCYGAFAATALATVLCNAPFTATQGRMHVPREFWRHPVFLRVNRHLSLVWAAVFALNGVLMLWSEPHPVATLAGCYALLAAAIVFSDRYPVQVRQRAARAAQQMAEQTAPPMTPQAVAG